jgi:predicted nucleic-acid-binding Zn-ribbon protein
MNDNIICPKCEFRNSLLEGVPLNLSNFIDYEDIFWTKIRLSYVKDDHIQDIHSCKGCGYTWGKDISFKASYHESIVKDDV